MRIIVAIVAILGIVFFLGERQRRTRAAERARVIAVQDSQRRADSLAVVQARINAEAVLAARAESIRASQPREVTNLYDPAADTGRHGRAASPFIPDAPRRP